MDCFGLPAMQKGGRAMNFGWLSPEQRREVCSDLLYVEHAGRMPEVWSLLNQLLREHRPASPWQWVAIDRLAKQAASLCGGSPNYWREAAAAALGVQSRADVGIEAICSVADDERQQELRRAAPRPRLTVGSRMNQQGGRR